MNAARLIPEDVWFHPITCNSLGDGLLQDEHRPRVAAFCDCVQLHHEPTMLSERRLQLIDLVGERVDQLLQLGGRLEVVVVHRGLHLVFRLLLPCEQLRQTRGARVVPARRRSLG